MRIERRILRDSMNPFDTPDFKFFKDFRLSKFAVRVLIEELKIHAPEESRADSIPFHLKVLCALYYFANGSDQSCIGNSAWMSLSQIVTS